jgi:hypothetical protein
MLHLESGGRVGSNFGENGAQWTRTQNKNLEPGQFKMGTYFDRTDSG